MEDIATATNGTSTGAVTASNAVESSSKKEQITELAMNLLVQGRRHLLVSDIPSAIAALAESSQLLVEQYGEFADECAESYYYYGMALLEMARTDSDVLGDAVEGGDKTEGGDSDDEEDEENGDEDGQESEEDEEEEKGKEPVNGVTETNGKSEKPTEVANEVETNGTEVKSSAEKTTEKSEDVEMNENEVPPEKKNGDVESKHEGEVVEKTNGEKVVIKAKNEAKGKSLKAAGSSIEAKVENGDAGEDISDEVSNLQLAWEVFELAKNIYQRKAETDPSAKPKLADALIRLAEVAIESENYSSAIEDLLKCLEIQTASFPSDSRSVAETHYQLGVAYTFTTDFKEAIRSFEAAASVIQLRIENLKNPSEKKPSMEEPKNLFHTIEGEIEELETLLPDIREKIADTIDLEKEALRKIAENGTNGAGPSNSSEACSSSMETETTMTSGESPNSSKPATDITHLIRKKRKPEEGAEADASAAKKVCTDVAATADGVA